MPEDVMTPAPSAGTATVPTETPATETPSDPVKAAIHRGDHAEMNRLMNDKKRQRSGYAPKKEAQRVGQVDPPPPTPSAAGSAPASPVKAAPDSGAGQQPGEPQAPDKKDPAPGTKEYNFRELQADRDRWKAEAQRAADRLRNVEQRPPASESAKPLDIAFTEPRPDFNRILEASDTLEEANAKYAQQLEAWIAKRDAARDREVQTRTRQTLSHEQERQRLIGLATAIREKVDALAKTDGFADLPGLYAESQSPYTDEMLGFYADDEHGARVMHHMILNPGVAQELTMLPPRLQKARLAEIRDSLIQPKPAAPTKQTTDAPNPIRKAVTGRSDAPVDPLKAARDEGQKTGNWKKFNALMNERKRHRMGTV